MKIVCICHRNRTDDNGNRSLTDTVATLVRVFFSEAEKNVSRTDD